MKKYLYSSLLAAGIILNGCASKSENEQDSLSLKKENILDVRSCSEKTIIESYYTNLNKIDSSYALTDSYTMKMNICKIDSEHVRVDVQDTLVLDNKPKANFTSSKIPLMNCESKDKEDITKNITSDVNRKIGLCKRKDGLVDFSLEIKTK